MKVRICFQIIALLVSALSVTSCFKDNSTLAQLQMPDIYIDVDHSIAATEWLVYIGEESVLDLPIVWGDEDPKDFDFKWTLNGEVISTEQVLRYTFMEAATLYITFQIFERATGLGIGEALKVSVSTKYLLGWLILSDKGGRSALDFIHIDTHELYPDIYNTLYPDDPLGSEPFKLVEHCNSTYDQIVVLQKGGPGLIILDGRTFEKVIRVEEEFMGEKYPYEGFNPVDIYFTNINSRAEILLTDKGEAYSRLNIYSDASARFQSCMFPTVPMTPPDERGMQITNYTFPKLSYYFVLFDGLNNRWLAISKTDDVMIPPWEKEFDPEDPELPIEGPEFFDFCEGMDPRIKLVYAQNCNEWTPSGYFINILKDTESGKYYYQRSVVRSEISPRNMIFVSSPRQFEFAPGYAINDESVFCLLRGQNTHYQDSPHMFFSLGDKLYVYREQNDRVFLYKDFGMVDDPPTGKIVSIMHSPAPDQNQLISVAFSDGHFFIMNCTDVMDEIARGDLDPLNPADAEKIELAHYSGLGEIKHAIFKYGRFSNWSSEEQRYR